MKAVVVYESMYGNTHLVAEAVAEGLRTSSDDVLVVPVGAATRDALADADLVVVGGPTHVHGLSRESTRKAAAEAAREDGSGLDLDPDAEGPALRDWFDAVGALPPSAAAFDTRLKAPAMVTGRASKGIATRLRAHGSTLVAEPMSFLVTKENHLVDDEATHARDWGAAVGTTLAAANGAE